MNNGNKSIFPQKPDNSIGPKAMLPQSELGLTKREYAAIKAMQGLLACSSAWLGNQDMLAKESVAMADALLKELER